jgi:hypothetical protein
MECTPKYIVKPIRDYGYLKINDVNIETVSVRRDGRVWVFNQSTGVLFSNVSNIIAVESRRTSEVAKHVIASSSAAQRFGGKTINYMHPRTATSIRA